MNCRHAIHLAALEADGELAPRQLRRLHSHLARCPACGARRGEHAALAATLRSVLQCEDAALGPAFADALHARLTAEQGSRDSTPIAKAAARLEQTARWCPALPRVATALATVMFCLTVALLLVPLASPHSDMPAQNAATGHLASFSIGTSRDGSLCARLIDRSAPPRLRQRRDIQ